MSAATRRAKRVAADDRAKQMATEQAEAAAQAVRLHDQRNPYYAKDGQVWKRGTSEPNPAGGKIITVGFPVLTMHDAAGAEAAATVAELMNRGQHAEALRDALQLASDHLDYCGYGDAWERECAEAAGLEKTISDALELVPDNKTRKAP